MICEKQKISAHNSIMSLRMVACRGLTLLKPKKIIFSQVKPDWYIKLSYDHG